MGARTIATTVVLSCRAAARLHTIQPSICVIATPSKTQHRCRHDSARLSRVAARIPRDSWDTHMHVVDPQKFPLDRSAQYQASAHTLDQAQSFLSQVGITKMVIVQPSIYGNDNSCTLDGLQRLGPEHGRAVIQFDPATTSKDQLDEWHRMGVRGVRLNFKSVGATPSAEELEAAVSQYATAIRPFGWVLEFHIALEDVPLLEQAVEKVSGVKICIDHFASPHKLDSVSEAKNIPGFQSLMNMLDQGNTWVKLSAGYRLSKDPSDSVVESLCKEIVRRRPDRCVFATDWPHTRFESIDVSEYLEKILDWCEEEGVDLHKILVTNAEELFDVKSS